MMQLWFRKSKDHHQYTVSSTHSNSPIYLQPSPQTLKLPPTSCQTLWLPYHWQMLRCSVSKRFVRNWKVYKIKQNAKTFLLNSVFRDSGIFNALELRDLGIHSPLFLFLAHYKRVTYYLPTRRNQKWQFAPWKASDTHSSVNIKYFILWELATAMVIISTFKPHSEYPKVEWKLLCWGGCHGPLDWAVPEMLAWWHSKLKYCEIRPRDSLRTHSLVLHQIMQLLFQSK